MKFLSTPAFPAGLPIAEGGTGATTAATARANLDLGNAALASAELIQCGRISLTSGVPVTGGDIVGASTIYFTPCRGNIVSIYDGSAFISCVFAEQGRSLSGLTPGKNYDVFAFHSGGSTVIDLGPAWTNDASRAATVGLLNGVHVDNPILSLMFSDGSVAANQATLLGTIRATGATTTEDSYTKRWGGNLLHPVKKMLVRVDGMAHSLTTTTILGWNNQATHSVEWGCPIATHTTAPYTHSGFQPPGTGTQGARVGLECSSTPQFVPLDFCSGTQATG